jgi:hypothetical protein
MSGCAKSLIGCGCSMIVMPLFAVMLFLFLTGLGILVGGP